MYTSVITQAEKVTLQEDGSLLLDVEFNILDEGKVVETKKLAFAPDIAPEAILDEIKRYTQNYGAEIESATVNAEKDEVLAEADATIESIIGQEVTTE